ncbi:hypothetical protein FB45DRAFT_1033014 [Roridomyces roridus]|uniref:Uncharacterized protein n=1 Tax=Roridomyces roridus TaxID=1738132 RepID=A0AAD7BGN2_9AGAR|nr:hypothetical protein FB45DRAFT_1033014 [Roridomyces roridus]
MWQRPEAFNAVQRYAPSLPHLRELLVAFLIGARATWIKFSKEFAPGGALEKATPEQIEEAWLSVTNDLCESSFGTWRQQSKANPTLSIHQHNARQMYKFNNTAEFLRSLSPDMRKFLRGVTREQDASGRGRAQRVQMATHKQEVTMENTQKDAAKEERKRKAREELEKVVPLLTITEFSFRKNLKPMVT